MYGRHFLTTGSDRRRRMLSRNDNALQGEGGERGGDDEQERWEPSAPPPPSGEHLNVALSAAANQLEVQINTPAAHSTHLPNRLGLGGVGGAAVENGNVSMEIDNAQMHQAVNFDPRSQSVDIVQHSVQERGPHEFWSISANSDASQYRELAEFPRRENFPAPRINPSQTNPFLPGYGVVEQTIQGETNRLSYQNAAAGMPYVLPMNPASNIGYQLMPHCSQNVYVRNEMSKTDRTVLMELLKNVRVADGSDEFQLLNFLKDLKPLFDIAPNSGDEIVKLLIPKTKGQLFKLMVEATTARVSWENLHGAILSYFLPSTRLREIEALELDRPQRQNETFVEYTENIIAAAFALRTRMSENEIIEIILSKCDPVTKAHFAFNSRPNNVPELKMLANKVTSSIKAEMRYFGAANHSARNVMHASRPSFARQNAQNFSQPKRSFENFNSQRERVIKCYKCGGEGHVARKCPSLN